MNGFESLRPVTSRSPRRHSRLSWVHLAVSALLCLGLLAGCGGGYVTPEGDVTGNPPQNTPPQNTPPPGPPPQEGSPAVNLGDAPAPEVEIWTTSDRVFIASFRVDFAMTRNVLAIVGVFPDRWDQAVTVPFSQIREMRFRGGCDESTFELMRKGREDLELKQNEIFRVAISGTDGSSYEFYAIIPRIRGFKDGIRWEMGMASYGPTIDRIVFPAPR